MRAILTIYSLYQYDSTIFDDLTLPDGVDSSILIDEIIYELLDLELVYPNAEVMKTLIGSWSTRMLPLWEKLYALCNNNYAPLENYNRTETWTDTGTSSGSSSSESSHSISSVETSTTAELIPDSSSEAAGTTTGTQSSTHTGSVSGNIGVMSSQQMAEQELALREKLDIYKIITRNFKEKFCIMVY